MRILQVLDKTAQEGGVAVHVADLSLALRERGHDVEILRLFDTSQPAPPGCPGDSLRLPFSYGVIPGLMRRAALRELLGIARPQLIHLHGAFTRLSPLLLADMQACAPVVGTLHDTRPFCFVMTRRFAPTGEPCSRRCGAGCFTTGCVRPADAVDALRLVRRWAMDGASLRQWRTLSRVVVPSTWLGGLAEQHGIPADRLRVVPHGTQVMAQATARRSGANPPGIVYVGSLLDYKGVGVLVDALAELEDLPWTAAFIGDGPMRAALEQQLRRHGLRERVALMGHVADRKVITARLAEARMLVLPSIVPESFGMAGLEALAAGAPVVSFGLGGVAEWLRDGIDGLVAHEVSATELARQMRRLLLDGARAEQLGANGIDEVRRRFTKEMAIDRLASIYAELAIENRSSIP